MVLAAALAAAAAYAVAMVLQHRGAGRADPGLSLRPGLVAALLRQRAWQLGIVANVAAFVLRAVALSRGSLVLVQPLVLSGLVMALVLDALTARRSITGVEAAAGVAVVAGLSLFLGAASPTRGVSAPSLVAWTALALAAMPLVGFGLVVARRTTGDTKAAWLAFAGGFLLAATAALVKQSGAALGDDGVRVLSTWAPSALVAVTGAGVVVTQSAFQAGSLRASLPVLSVVEPLASIAIGVSVFRERVATSPAAVLVEAVGLALLVAGVVTLTRREPDARRANVDRVGDDGAVTDTAGPPRTPGVRRIAVVPAYNEEATVAAVLDRLAPLVDELVIVDDGSVDGTRAAIEGVLPRHPQVRLLTFDSNRGMSAAYYAAFCDLRARRDDGALVGDDLVFTVDADGQHELAVLDDLHARAVAERLDALLVRRDLSAYPAYKRLGNWVLSAWASAWAGRRLADVESGYRVFRLGALCDALDYYRGYRYSETVEVAVVLCRLGYRVRNDVVVPVPLYRSRTTLGDAVIDLAAIPAAAWRVRRRRRPALGVETAS